MTTPDDATIEFAISVARAIRSAVAPHLGRASAREATGRAPGGDVTMAVDEIAEDVLDAAVRAHGDLAYYSEDRGHVVVGAPRALLVVDPIDGTRPAAAGFEAACVSIAVAPASRDATFADVAGGVVLVLGSGQEVVARRGAGVRVDGRDARCAPLGAHLERLFWAATQRGRPSLPIAVVLEDLVDGSAMEGGYFDLGSAAFTMTRLVTGQLDAYVDPGARLLADHPALDGWFRRVGRGARCTNFPYDVAAAMLAVQEAGGVVTTAAGEPLDDRPVVGSGPGYEVSVVAAVDRALSDALIDAVDRGMVRLARWLRTVEIPEAGRGDP